MKGPSSQLNISGGQTLRRKKKGRGFMKTGMHMRDRIMRMNMMGEGEPGHLKNWDTHLKAVTNCSSGGADADKE